MVRVLAPPEGARAPVFHQEGGNAPVAEGQGVGGAPPQDGAAQVRQHRVELYIQTDTTGANVDEHNRVRPGKTDEFTRFTPELLERYNRFLQGYITTLARLSNRDAFPDPGIPGNPLAVPPIPAQTAVANWSLMDRLLSNPDHVYDKVLIDQFIKVGQNSSTGAVTERTPNLEKLNAFLETDQGRMIAQQLLDIQTEVKLYGLGLDASVMPPGDRGGLADQNHVFLDFDQGFLSRVFQNHVFPYLGERVMTADGRVHVEWHGVRGRLFRDLRRGWLGVGSLAPTALGFMTGLRVGGLQGGIVGAAGGFGLYWAGVGYGRLTRGGLALDIRQCSAAFQAIQGNAAEAGYVREMFGIDTRDYQVDPAHPDRLIPRLPAPVVAGGPPVPWNPLSRTNANELKREVIGAIDTRIKFLRTLPIRKENIDALSTQAQARELTQGRGEQIRTWWAIRTENYFEHQLGGRAPTIRENIQQWIQAQRMVLKQYLNEWVESQNAESSEALGESRISTLGAKRDARTAPAGGGEPPAQAERTRQFTARKTLYTEAKTLLGTDEVPGEQQRINAYNVPVRAIQTARENAQRNFTVSDIAGIDAQLLIRENELHVPTVPPVPANIAQRDFELNRDMQAFRAPLIGALPRRATPDDIDNVKRITDLHFGARLQVLERDKTRINGQITQLNTLRSTIETNQNTLAETEPTARGNTELFAVLQRDHDQIMGNPAAVPAIIGIDAQLGALGLPAAGLTPANFANLSIDQLLTRINTANTTGAAAGPPVIVGWPEAQNRRPERRRQILHAMIEARAQAAEALDPARTPVRIGNYNILIATVGATPWGLTENQLRTLSQAEIAAELARRALVIGGGVAPPGAPAIQDAMQEAQSRLQVRFDAFAQVNRDLDRWIEEQDDQIATVDFAAETRTLNLTIDLLNREKDDKIYPQVAEISARNARFVGAGPMEGNTIPVAPVAGAGGDADWNTYSQQEQTAGGVGPPPVALSRGYYEIMDILFDYKNKPNRGEYFQQVYQLLPPERLAELLNESLDLVAVAGMAPPPPFNLPAVLAGIEYGLNRLPPGAPPLPPLVPPRGTLGSTNLTDAFRHLITRLHNQANRL